MSGGLAGRDRGMAAALRAAPQELQRDLERRYRAAARDAAGKAQAAIRGASSRHPGPLREEIAGTVGAGLQRRGGGDGLTMKVTSSGTRMPPGKENLPAYADGASARRWSRWRHPVYGHDWWVPQEWPSARGWFTVTLRGQAGELAAAAQRALDDLAAKLGGP